MGVRLSAVLLVVSLVGCSHDSAGTEASARKHFNAEFQKWMAGEKTEVATLRSVGTNLRPPIGYDVRSVVPRKPDTLDLLDDGPQGGSPGDAKEWSSWKFNVAIEWESQAGTPFENVATYTLTWNPRRNKWIVLERH